MATEHDDALIGTHLWLTEELGLEWDPPNKRWTHAELGLEVRVDVARTLIAQGRLAELRANVVAAMHKKAARCGVRFGVPGVVDPLPGAMPDPALAGRGHP